MGHVKPRVASAGEDPRNWGVSPWRVDFAGQICHMGSKPEHHEPLTFEPSVEPVALHNNHITILVWDPVVPSQVR